MYTVQDDDLNPGYFYGTDEEGNSISIEPDSLGDYRRTVTSDGYHRFEDSEGNAIADISSTD